MPRLTWKLEGQAAGRMLRGRLLDQALGEVQQWAIESEPVLDEPWQQQVGVFNTGIRLSIEEARCIEGGIEELLAPYVTRGDAAVPADARTVRMVRITMPEPPDNSTELGCRREVGVVILAERAAHQMLPLARC